MNIEEAFPSKYLKAADLQGRSVVVKMATIRMEKVGDDQRPVLYFVGKEKGVVLNKSNKNSIVDMYGAETDEWTGKPIELFTAYVDYQGKQTEAIRIRKPSSVIAGPSKPVVEQRMYEGDDAEPVPF